MEQHSDIKKFAEHFLSRIPGSRARLGPISKSEVGQLLSPDYTLDNPQTLNALKILEDQGLVKMGGNEELFLKITDPKSVGASRLIMNFCARHYGDVSPLVDRKMLQAVLRRHGAGFEIDSQEVQNCLKELETDGLIRIMGKENSYIKMLGTP